MAIRSTNPAIREANRGLARARDAQILKVVAMVDAMPDRGAADQLIAPLRERLARLRPPRPLRFARLLFLPLDPLIVPPARWRLEHQTIPRSVIPLLAAAVETAMGPAAGSVAAMVEGYSTDDSDVIDQAGGSLWNHAASILLKAEHPPDWETSGLGHQFHRPLSRRIGALLLQAVRLRHMTADAAQGLDPPEAAEVRVMLEDAVKHEPDAHPMLIALLLARVPEAAPVLLRVAAAAGGSLPRHGGEQAADILLDQLEAPGGTEAHLGGQDLAEAGATVRRLTALLGALDGEALAPGQRSRLDGVRERVRTGCEALFTERLATDLVEPLRAGSAAAGPDALWELETAARGLRVLETEARRAGDDKTYDVLLASTAGLVRQMIERGELDRTGGLRLMEIVAGPEEALASFGELG